MFRVYAFIYVQLYACLSGAFEQKRSAQRQLLNTPGYRRYGDGGHIDLFQEMVDKHVRTVWRKLALIQKSPTGREQFDPRVW